MIRATLEGLADLRRALGTVTPAASRLTEAQLVAAARMVAADARQFAPVRTGALRNSIQTGGTGLLRWVGVTGKPQAYAVFVHYGTSTTVARPFMYSAARREEDRLPGRTRAIAAALPGEVRR